MLSISMAAMLEEDLSTSINLGALFAMMDLLYKMPKYSADH